MSFCPACEEEVSSPPPDGICLTCGEELTASPSSSSNDRSNGASNRLSRPPAAPGENDDAAATNAMAMLASSMENAAAVDPAALMPLVNQLRGGDAALTAGGADAVDGGANGVEDLMGILPAEALNPQAAGTSSRPASQFALDGLKRIKLTAQSAELFDAQVSLFEPRPINELSPRVVSDHSTNGSLTLNAVPGEFGPISTAIATDASGMKHGGKNMKLRQPRMAALIVCSPRTAKGGKLSSQTLEEIDTLRQHRTPFIAYVERGDGLTFVQKAIVCQRAGEPQSDMQQSKPLGTSEESLCIGVIVGNSSTGGKEVWPYIMQDTKRESQAYGLKVPVVMIRRDDGVKLRQWSKKLQSTSEHHVPCRLNVHSKDANSHTCPVCTDSYVPGDVIVRLPKCNHVFHERCALAWLKKHNTCPFCRAELPTDDDDYERERRRRERRSEDVADGSGTVGGHNFYG